MPIPHAARVTFADNPLTEVVSQFAFPRLLEIDQELPVKFQKQVQDAYPVLKTAQVVEIAFDLQKGSQRSPETRRYEFWSKDEKWQLVLTSNFVALTTSEYRDWADFKGRIIQVVKALTDCYKPAHFQRVGLRYRDTISRTRLKLEGTPWSELLQPHILGPLAPGGLQESEVIGFRNSFALRLPSEAKVQIHHGILATEAGDSDYTIDSDFFVDQTTEANEDAAAATLERFRPHTNNLFHWCITQQLFDAMGPQALPE